LFDYYCTFAHFDLKFQAYYWPNSNLYINLNDWNKDYPVLDANYAYDDGIVGDNSDQTNHCVSYNGWDEFRKISHSCDASVCKPICYVKLNTN